MRAIVLGSAAGGGFPQWNCGCANCVAVREGRPGFRERTQDSMAINSLRSGAVIVAASGMCEAGRIKHHLRHNLPRDECAIVFTGFQAAGTLGRQLVDGATRVRLFREEVAVRASRHTIGGLSAHADQAALLGWLGAFRRAPECCYVVHGEQSVATGFAALVRERLQWPAVTVPQRGDVVRPFGASAPAAR